MEELPLSLPQSCLSICRFLHARLNQNHTQGRERGPATLIRISADGGGPDADPHFCGWPGARAATRALS